MSDRMVALSLFSMPGLVSHRLLSCCFNMMSLSATTSVAAAAAAGSTYAVGKGSAAATTLTQRKAEIQVSKWGGGM